MGRGSSNWTPVPQVFLCTSPIVTHPGSFPEKFVWAAAVLGERWRKRVIITSDKTLVQGRVLIDDKIEISGIATPTWQHVLFRRPYHDQHGELIARKGLGDVTLIHWKDWKTHFQRLGLLPTSPAPPAAAQWQSWIDTCTVWKNRSLLAKGWLFERVFTGKAGLCLQGAAGGPSEVFKRMATGRSWTLMVWVRPECYALGGDRDARFSLFGCGEPSDVTSFFHVSAQGPCLHVQLGSDTLQSGGDALPQEAWSHVAVVYDSVQQTLKLLVNAKLVASVAPVKPLRAPVRKKKEIEQQLAQVFVGSRGTPLQVAIAGTTWKWKADSGSSDGELTLAHDGTTVLRSGQSTWNVHGERDVLCHDLDGKRCVLRFDAPFDRFSAYSVGAKIATGTFDKILNSPQPFKGAMKLARVIPGALSPVILQAVGKVCPP